MTVYVVNLDLQEPEITQFCFRDCGQILVGGIEFNNTAWCPCQTTVCPHLDRELSVGKVPFDWGEEKLVLRKLKPLMENIKDYEKQQAKTR